MVYHRNYFHNIIPPVNFEEQGVGKNTHTNSTFGCVLLLIIQGP